MTRQADKSDMKITQWKGVRGRGWAIFPLNFDSPGSVPIHIKFTLHPKKT